MTTKERELTEENRRLRWKLDEELRQKYGNDEATYLRAAEAQDAMDNLTQALREQERLDRHFSAQLAYLRSELSRLAECVSDLAEHRRGAVGFSGAMRQALDLLAGREGGKKPRRSRSQKRDAMEGRRDPGQRMEGPAPDASEIAEPNAQDGCS